MNKRERENQFRMYEILQSLGFTYDECERLRRISMQLRAWHERECGTDNGCIERDDETGRAYWRNSYSGRRYPIRDMEKGALARLQKIMGAHAPLQSYIQGDPRGAALYILRPGDVPEGKSPDGYYTRGICVY